jgi:hypothetical protein
MTLFDQAREEGDLGLWILEVGQDGNEPSKLYPKNRSGGSLVVWQMH